MDFKLGIVIFNKGPFGGAPRRFTNLFRIFVENNHENILYFVDYHLYHQLKEIYPDLPWKNIKIIDFKKNKNSFIKLALLPKSIKSVQHHDSDTLDSGISVIKKIYWFYKYMVLNFLLFRQIDKYRRELNIKIFLGVFGGIIPLYFYMTKKRKIVSIIFSNMDSWFYDVYEDMKKLWYRKYLSFNYGLENSDLVDFLSPFIYDGILKKNIKIKKEKVSIAPCSFSDYSNCFIGDKSIFKVAFAARLEPDKNPRLFLESALILSQKYPDIQFYLLGEGSSKDELVKFINENNLQKVVTLQFHKRPTEILSTTSVFVSIQTTNNYPSQSVLEAMACGNAIVASDVGDTRMFINENNGILINLDVDSITRAIEKLYINRELVQKMGAYAREYVLKNHSIDNALQYYHCLFNKAYKTSNKKSG